MPVLAAWPNGIPLTPEASLRRLVDQLVAAGGDDDTEGILAAIVQRISAARGQTVCLTIDNVQPAPALAVLDCAVDETLLADEGPWIVGLAREAVLSAAARHRSGVHHTSAGVVDAVIDAALAVAGPLTTASRVLDPAVGGGAFVLRMLERLPGERRSAAASVIAFDIDPVAVGVARAAVELWAGELLPDLEFHTGDFCVAAPTELVDIVVGNPPFRSQLKSDTARSEAERTQRAKRWPEVSRYVDEASAFMLAAAEWLRPEGVFALVQPDSVLGAGDGEGVRQRLAEIAPIAAIWADRERHFSASIDTIAVVCGGATVDGVRLFEGVPARLHPASVERPSPSSWAPILAAFRGVPHVPASTAVQHLGELATVTAGFRDHFYGLRGAVIEDPAASHRLMTSGLIDPLVSWWGKRSCRFDKAAYTHPAVVLGRVDPAVSAWIKARLVPKLLVANQTKTIEAVADPDGELVPVTPVISIEPHDVDDLWHLAAVVTCPVASARLATAATGTALSSDSVRVSARSLAALPLPADRAAWDEAAAAAREGDPVRCASAMLAAHGLGDRDDLLAWWRDRIPTF